MSLWTTPWGRAGHEPPKPTPSYRARQPVLPSRAAGGRLPRRAAHSWLAHSCAMMVVAIMLVGCGSSVPDAASDTEWNGRSTVVDASSGLVEFHGFNDYLDDRQPSWADDARKVAATALQLGRSQEPHRTRMRVRHARSTTPSVQVTFSSLLDDSTTAVRYEIRMRRGSDGTYRIDESVRTSRCRWGRGGGLLPGGFTAKPCA